MTDVSQPEQSSRFSAVELLRLGAHHVGRLNLRSRWVWGSTLYLQTAALFTYDIPRREIVNPESWLIIFISYAGYWLLYPLLIWIVDRVKEAIRWAWIGPGLLLMGTSRGYLLELIFTETPSAAWTSFVSRLPGDVTIGLITVISMSELMYSTNRHVAAMSRLTNANATLLEARKATSYRASSTERNLREMAQNALLGELDRIREHISKAGHQQEIRLIAEQIRELITNQVRPLSRKLRNRLDDLTATKELKAVRKPLRFGRPNTVHAYQDTRIVGTYLLAMPNVLLTINSLSSPMVTMAAFGASLAIFPIGLGLRKLFSYAPLRSRLSNWLAMNAILVLSYLPLQLTTVYFSDSHPGLAPIRATGIGVFLFVGVCITLWRAIERSRDQIEAELSDLNLELARSTAIVEQQIWLAQKKWAYLVHGTVQGALTVAASRLQLANQDSPADVKQILKELDKAVVALKGDWSQEQPFSKLAKETQETWTGVLSLEISIDKSAKTLLENMTTARCASEIIKELAGNAYRHGKAKQLFVSIGKNADGDLWLKASNDGSPIKGEVNGLGSDLFTDLTMSWSISEDSHGVNFEAVLPGVYPLSESNQS
jgi:two-component sensor histidine kinase